MTKILDCTLRDGGYYTDWDFDSRVVAEYVAAMKLLPVDYIEIGYRNKPSKDYLGQFGYSPVTVIKNIRKHCTKKLVVMLNEKSTSVDDLDLLLSPIAGLVDMIRIAIDPANFDRAIVLAQAIKAMGFEVGFNCMYMSKWKTEYPDFLSKLHLLNDFCDLFCMVDSFGGVFPDDVRDIYAAVRANTTVPVGFHGHNNLQMGLINTLTAMELGVEYVDATILGMGRGAGNLNLELLLTALNAKHGLDVDFNLLGELISTFTPLHEKHQWGTNLPYMLAGANNIPQKEVMDWVTNRVYSFNSIVRALHNRKHGIADNAKFSVYDFNVSPDNVIVLGGGNSVKEHIDGIKQFIATHPSTALIFPTSRHATLFNDINCRKYYILVGNENRRFAANVNNERFPDVVILPPFPRPMGTDVPAFAHNNTFELSALDFVSEYKDSCTSVALQVALNLGSKNVYVVGYDGYPGNVLSEKEMALTHENKVIFEAYQQYSGTKLLSLTPSLYKELKVTSIYQYI